MDKRKQAFEQVCRAFLEFFEWLYYVDLDGPAGQRVRAAVADHWADPDESVRELVVYVLGLNEVMSGATPREAYRDSANQIFADLFSTFENNGRGQVLRMLKAGIDVARAGAAPAAEPAAATPPRPAAPSARPAKLSATDPKPWAQVVHSVVSALSPVVMQAVTQAAEGAADRLTQSIGGSPPATGSRRPPANAAPASALPAGATGPAMAAPAPGPAAAPLSPPPAAPPSAHVGAGASGLGSSFPDVPAVQQALRNAVARQQQILLDNKLWELQNETVQRLMR